MDKKLFVHLQGGRKVSGTLRGYDLFLNLVLDDALEESTPAQRHPIGTVVSAVFVHSSYLDSRGSCTGNTGKQRHLYGDSGSYTVMIRGLSWEYFCTHTCY
jgi:small nuclear ribonucleoprotein (snRNP)-like protein